MVSILIVNYNTFELTCKCLESIYKFTKKLDFEVILVDNASPEKRADEFLQLFPNIILIKSPENVGFAKGNNLALAQAKGDYILLLNSDVELLENSIKICVDFFETNPKIGVVSPKLIYPNDIPQNIAQKFPSIQYELNELLRISHFQNKKNKAKNLGIYTDHTLIQKVDWVWGAFWLTKREILDKLPQKKLPDTFFMYFEDVWWGYEITQLGYEVYYFPQTKAIHYVSASSGGEAVFNEKKQIQITENEIHFLKLKKGKFYTKMLFWLRGLKFMSLRKKQFRDLGWFYWKMMQKIK